MSAVKIIRTIHLWLGLTSGLVVVFLGITGCILAFQREIETLTHPYQFVVPQSDRMLPPSRMYAIAARALPGKPPHSIAYGTANKSAVITFYQANPEYYFLVYVNPYNGSVLHVSNMADDFFRIVINGHFYLWLPHSIGQPVVATATLIFVVMMITGIILWWPRNKAARRQRFTVKWNVRWRRLNYDLHSVLGFYMSWVAIIIAFTGLVWGFQWFAHIVYGVTSGGKKAVEYYEPVSMKSDGGIKAGEPATDWVWAKMNAEYPDAAIIEVHYPEHDSAAIAASANPDATTYWKNDYRYFDQFSLKEISVKHLFGRLKDAGTADKIARMNYDIHVGAAFGITGKIMAFFASLIAASLPITGFYIWWGKKFKSKKKYGSLNTVIAQNALKQSNS
jgi:uncharacterized iron-regulated membrane protein